MRGMTFGSVLAVYAVADCASPLNEIGEFWLVSLLTSV